MPREKKEWYVVRALYRLGVKAQTRSRKRALLEERILLVRSAPQAVLTIAKTAALTREHSYKNSNGQRVSWKLQQILDVSKVIETAIRHGTEIYNRYHHNAVASATIKRLGFRPGETSVRR